MISDENEYYNSYDSSTINIGESQYQEQQQNQKQNKDKNKEKKIKSIKYF